SRSIFWLREQPIGDYRSKLRNGVSPPGQAWSKTLLDRLAGRPKVVDVPRLGLVPAHSDPGFRHSESAPGLPVFPAHAAAIEPARSEMDCRSCLSVCRAGGAVQLLSSTIGDRIVCHRLGGIHRYGLFRLRSGPQPAESPDTCAGDGETDPAAPRHGAA